jgi:hypothetical protein
LREVVCPVLKLREEKWTFVIVGGGKIDFFRYIKPTTPLTPFSFFFPCDFDSMTTTMKTRRGGDRSALAGLRLRRLIPLLRRHRLYRAAHVYAASPISSISLLPRPTPSS